MRGRTAWLEGLRALREREREAPRAGYRRAVSSRSISRRWRRRPGPGLRNWLTGRCGRSCPRTSSGRSCGQPASPLPVTTCSPTPTPARPRAAARAGGGREAGRTAPGADGRAARVRKDRSAAAGAAGRGPGGAGAHRVFDRPGNRWSLCLNAAQTGSVAYAFYLRSMAGSVAEVNQFARDYGVVFPVSP
ncbi:DUF6417 family protein [Streptomyces sp. NPDC006739]|uniref:DUF6417 family protein n=1 Tax=Streptomyces sp. NPDC006739 TaxID=3364763 RepID=UPI00368BDD94